MGSSCDLDKNIDVFKSYLEKVFKFFGSISIYPIKAEILEQYIWATLAVCYGKDNVIWQPGSHQRTVDIIIRSPMKEIKLALKSGEYKDNYITMSSYRLTSEVVRDDPSATLQKMLNTIYKEYNKIDYIMLCVRDEKGNVRKYQIYLVPPILFKDPRFFNPNNWYIKQGKSFWDFYLKPIIANMLGINARIIGSMSYQLWYEINQGVIDQYKLFDTPLEFNVEKIKMNLIEQIRKIISS